MSLLDNTYVIEERSFYNIKIIKMTPLINELTPFIRISFMRQLMGPGWTMLYPDGKGRLGVKKDADPSPPYPPSSLVPNPGF